MALPRRDDALASALPAVLPDREMAALRRSLLAWYDAAGRSLAIRAPGIDPWAILVAEVMAQQTQVGRVEAPWRAFLDRFPDPAALAGASPAEAIRAWRGLGYNRRALDLHGAATAIAALGGQVPDDPLLLERLPGIGRYTARAVAATAYGRPVGPVDVNVRRVLGRLLIGDPTGLGPTQAQSAADRLVDRRRPADWNHALMDLGALACRPASPTCPGCPVRNWCRAAAAGPPPGRGDAAADKFRQASPGHRSRATTAPIRFESTARWLRGRLVDRLRDAPSGAWVAISGPLGEHSASAVRTALGGLAADGLVELDAAGRARLPVDRPFAP